jgi:hypothetical protein
MTRLACVTYTDEFSAGNRSLNDLRISYENKVFAAGMNRLKLFDHGDYVIICATEDRKRYCFIALIIQKLEEPLKDWHNQGGMIWKYNFYIKPLTKIVEISKKTSIRNKCDEICTRLGFNENNLFNMRFCSEKLLPVIDEIINIMI